LIVNKVVLVLKMDMMMIVTDCFGLSHAK